QQRDARASARRRQRGGKAARAAADHDHIELGAVHAAIFALESLAMPVSFDGKLVVAISSRALFDLEESNRVFEEQGIEAYSRYQLQHEDEFLSPGIAFPLV